MIKVILKPEKGIQIDETKKYLFDPSVVQPYVDASAENATKAEENANRTEQTFANVSAFVDTSKSEITGIIEQGKTEIATAIDDGRMEISDSILEATEEVKKAGQEAAQEAAQEAVQSATDEATRIATEQVNTYVVEVVSPQIQEFVNNAEADASNAAESAGLAAEEANKSSVFASDSQHYAEDARIWAEGEQAKVQELGGELSSKGWTLQASNSATSASQSATQAKTSETNAQASAVRSENSAVRAEEAEQRIMESGALPSQAGNEGKYLTTDGTEASWAEVGGGLEIGDIGFAPLGIDETQNKRRYLNGQVISQSQFESFTKKIKEAIAVNSNLATSETNWQAEVTNSPYGICGKFVIDDTLGTIRLPKYPDWSIREVGQAAVVGNGMALGMTDGTDNYGLIGLTTGGYNKLSGSAGSYGSTIGSERGGDNLSNGLALGITTDATKSGIIADLVNANTEDKLQGKWFIQVATGVEESVDVTREIELNNPFSLLDYKWSEYEITNASWLISNGAFHSGATYVAVYELLHKIYNGIVTKEGVSVKLSTEAYEDTDFVLNTADTTFRLPIKVKLASGSAVIGNGMNLGLTDGTNSVGLQIGVAATNAGLGVNTNNYGGDVGTSVNISGWTSNKTMGVTTDPTKSGIETSSSGLYLYFYVGETIQDANVVNASGVLTRFAELSNEYIVGLGMPDYNAGVSVSSYPYTAQFDCFYFGIFQRSRDATITMTLNGVTTQLWGGQSTYNSYDGIMQIYLNKGDVLSFNYNPERATVYKLKGVK